MKHLICLLFAPALALLMSAGCDQQLPGDTGAANESALAGGRVRTSTLKNAAGANVARVLFTKVGGDRVLATVTVAFSGLRAGFHGFHIHANDNAANGDGCIADPAQPANTHFVSADGHWNPTAAGHGEHAGDTPGVLVLDDGSALLSYVDEFNLDDVVGRALILHEGMDNFGNIPPATTGDPPVVNPNGYTPNSDAAVTLTRNTGNAGNRVACGIIQ